MTAKTPGALPITIVLILMCVCVCALASAKRTGAVLAFAAALLVFQVSVQPSATGVFLPLPHTENAPSAGPVSTEYVYSPAPPLQRQLPSLSSPQAATTTAEHRATRAAFATSTVLTRKPPRPVQAGDPDPSLTRSAPHHGAGIIDASAFHSQATASAHARAIRRRDFASAQTPLSLDDISKLRSMKHTRHVKNMKVATQPQRHFSL